MTKIEDMTDEEVLHLANHPSMEGTVCEEATQELYDRLTALPVKEYPPSQETKDAMQGILDWKDRCVATALEEKRQHDAKLLMQLLDENSSEFAEVAASIEPEPNTSIRKFDDPKSIWNNGPFHVPYGPGRLGAEGLKQMRKDWKSHKGIMEFEEHAEVRVTDGRMWTQAWVCMGDYKT